MVASTEAAHAAGAARTAAFQTTEYGTLSARIMEMLDRLRDAGAACEVPVPTIAVCGNQVSLASRNPPAAGDGPARGSAAQLPHHRDSRGRPGRNLGSRAGQRRVQPILARCIPCRFPDSSLGLSRLAPTTPSSPLAVCRQELAAGEAGRHPAAPRDGNMHEGRGKGAWRAPLSGPILMGINEDLSCRKFKRHNLCAPLAAAPALPCVGCPRSTHPTQTSPSTGLPCMLSCQSRPSHHTAATCMCAHPIMGLLLPRQCPTEVRLRAPAADCGSAWRCSIKLRRDFDATGARLPRPEEIKFASISAERRGALATAIRAAQKAHLNPSTDWRTYARVAMVCL
jgi:hypothetical protein